MSQAHIGVPTSLIYLGDIPQDRPINDEDILRYAAQWTALKPERNGTVAALLDEVTDDVAEDRSRMFAAGAPSGLGKQDISPDPSYEDILIPLSDEEIAANPLVVLHRYQRETIGYSIERWAQKQDARLAQTPPDELSVVDTRYLRLKEMINQGKQRNIGDFQVTKFLRNGAGTAVNTMWGVIEVIPRVFEAQFDRRITGEEYDAVVCASSPLIQKLAMGNNALAIGLLDSLKIERERVPEETPRNPFVYFNPDDFVLDTRSGTPQLEIKREAYERFLASDEIPDEYLSATTGCPATRNLIPLLLKWTQDLARSYVYPRYPSEQARRPRTNLAKRLLGYLATKVLRNPQSSNS